MVLLLFFGSHETKVYPVLNAMITEVPICKLGAGVSPYLIKVGESERVWQTMIRLILLLCAYDQSGRFIGNFIHPSES
jgi:hypothetical protein